MQSEHLTNLHVGWVVGGWLIAASVTAAAYLAGIGMGMVGPEQGAAVWASLSLAVGFLVGGAVVGMRWSDAPLIHGVALTFFSVFVWFIVSLLDASGPVDSVQLVLGLVLLQLVASCVGALMGRRWALGDPDGESEA